jgi:putative ABC transport system substrate-binding protein
MSYGIDGMNSIRQTATFIDKIFKGAKPGDIPIEQPVKIDLVINRKTAAALGLTVPPTLLMQATKVVG